MVYFAVAKKVAPLLAVAWAVVHEPVVGLNFAGVWNAQWEMIGGALFVAILGIRRLSKNEMVADGTSPMSTNLSFHSV